MNLDVFVKNVRTLIVGRLLVATILLCLGFWIFNEQRTLFSVLVVFLCLLSVAYIFWFVSNRRIRLLAYSQIIVDLIWETILIYFTGGVNSVFIVFYILTILGSSVVLPIKGAIWTTALTVLLFTFSVLIGFFEIKIAALSLFIGKAYSSSDWLSISYLVFVRLTMFVIVGYLGIYLSGRIFKLERRLKNQEQLTILGELTARIAHEIKNPLTAISGTIEVLNSELETQLTGENKEMMQGVVKETRRLKNILLSILDYSRVDFLQRESFDLIQALEEVLTVLQNSPQRNGNIKLIKNIEKRPFKFYGDSNRIKQMFFNLILNAFEAMPERGSLIISVKESNEEEGIVISITDTGIGIPKDIQKVLFQPFYSTKKGGTGLGLPIVQKIVENHGGTITFHSEINLGTEFVIKLPLLAK